MGDGGVIKSEISHCCQTKIFWETVGHNGFISKPPLSNLYFMATVEHLKNCRAIGRSEDMRGQIVMWRA